MATTQKYKVADGRRLSVYLNAGRELAKNVKLDRETGSPVDAKVQRVDLSDGDELNLTDDEAAALLADKTILTAKDYDVLKAAKDAGLVVDATPAVLMLPTEPDGSVSDTRVR